MCVLENVFWKRVAAFVCVCVLENNPTKIFLLWLNWPILVGFFQVLGERHYFCRNPIDVYWTGSKFDLLWSNDHLSMIKWLFWSFSQVDDENFSSIKDFLVRLMMTKLQVVCIHKIFFAATRLNPIWFKNNVCWKIIFSGGWYAKFFIINPT